MQPFCDVEVQVQEIQVQEIWRVAEYVFCDEVGGLLGGRLPGGSKAGLLGKSRAVVLLLRL